MSHAGRHRDAPPHLLVYLFILRTCLCLLLFFLVGGWRLFLLSAVVVVVVVVAFGEVGCVEWCGLLWLSVHGLDVLLRLVVCERKPTGLA